MNPEYCLSLVRQFDKPAFISGIFLPVKVRKAFYATRALNLEITRVKDATSENEMANLLRYQWWRELIDECYKDSPEPSQYTNHPLFKDLHDGVQAYGLTRRWLDRLVDAREGSHRQPDTMEDLEKYAELTASSLVYLHLEILGIRTLDADHVVTHIGKAIGISSMLYGFPQLTFSGDTILPRQVMNSNDLGNHAFQSIISKLASKKSKIDVSSEDYKALGNVIYEIASCAHGHLEHARELNVPKEAISAFLPVAHSSMFLERLQDVSKFDIFDPQLRHDPFWSLKLQYRITKSYYSSKF